MNLPLLARMLVELNLPLLAHMLGTYGGGERVEQFTNGLPILSSLAEPGVYPVRARQGVEETPRTTLTNSVTDSCPAGGRTNPLRRGAYVVSGRVYVVCGRGFCGALRRLCGRRRLARRKLVGNDGMRPTAGTPSLQIRGAGGRETPVNLPTRRHFLVVSSIIQETGTQECLASAKADRKDA